MGSMDLWRTIMLGVAALGQCFFILLYMTFPWWRSYLGRALFSRALMLTVLMTFAWLGRVYNFGRDDLAFIVLYTLLAAGIWFEFSAFATIIIRDGHRYWVDMPQGDPSRESRGEQADVIE